MPTGHRENCPTLTRLWTSSSPKTGGKVFVHARLASRWHDVAASKAKSFSFDEQA